MENPEQLSYLTKYDLPAVFGASMAILVLMRSSSRRCAVYQAEIEPLLTNGELGGIPVGGLLIDDAGRLSRLIHVITEMEAPALPATVIFWEGREVEFLLTTRASCLTRRIARVITNALIISSLEGLAGGVTYGRDRTAD